MRVVALAALAASIALAPVAAAQSLRFEVPQRPPGRWYKGNTHTHTLESDGDSPPDTVAMWYKRHGYRWLVLSDHNVFVDPRRFAALQDTSFLLVPGEELTTRHGRTPVHVNGLNLRGVVQPRTDSTLLGTVQKNVDAVREVRGVPHVNHPNFGWALSAGVLRQLQNDRLIEIFNGHPLVHNHGGGGVPSVEEAWDTLLTAGKRMYGIAVDDAHHFKEEFAPDRANPGKGWVVVRAPALRAGDLMDALEAGDFYASTGVELEDVVVTPTTLTVRILQQRDYKYTTQFIGTGGRVLYETAANPAVFTLPAADAFAPGTRYVRARVVDSGGRTAWVQPAFVRE